MIEKIYNYSKYSINFHFYFSYYKRCCLLSIPSTNTKLFTFYYTFIFTTITYFSYPSPKKLIFAYYILSVSLSCYISSSITQITFLNALSKSPYKQMQSLTRNNHITSNHLPLLLFTTSKDIFIRIFSIAALFSYSNVSIAVYTRTISLCNLASKIQGSRARSDAYEQTRRIFTLPSRKRLKEQPNQPLFLMLSISLKF